MLIQIELVVVTDFDQSLFFFSRGFQGWNYFIMIFASQNSTFSFGKQNLQIDCPIFFRFVRCSISIIPSRYFSVKVSDSRNSHSAFIGSASYIALLIAAHQHSITARSPVVPECISFVVGCSLLSYRSSIFPPQFVSYVNIIYLCHIFEWMGKSIL